MDDAAEVRADLRSYALRRCIRFYTALLVASLTWTASRLAGGPARAEILWGGAAVLAAITGVELSAMLVMTHMAKARARLGGGPETPLWAFAQGPWPSLVAAAFFGLVAAGLLVLGQR